MVAIGPVVSEEKSFEIVDGRRTDDGRRTTEPAYTISSPGAFGSGELKSTKVIRHKKLKSILKVYFALTVRKRTESDVLFFSFIQTPQTNYQVEQM